jgi:ATP/maltotriose-dependent transcriptional regulator MalT
MSPRDLAKHLGKDETDIVRRLRRMQSWGLVKSAWGTRLGKNVKLYSLATSGFDVNIQRDGIKINFDRYGNKSYSNSQIKTPTRIFEESVEEVVPAADVSAIVGRRQELDLLNTKNLNFIFIVGVAGMGKTSLAKKFAFEYLAAPKGDANAGKAESTSHIFWHTFKEIDTLPFILGRVAAFLSKRGVKDLILNLEQPSSTDDFITNTLAVTFSAMGKVSRLALIFDDYHKIKDEKISAFIKGLVDKNIHSNSTSSTKVIVLSRYEMPFYLDHPNCKELVLSGLPLKDAREIIDLQTPALDPQTLEDAWKRFGGHPMALKIFSLFTKETEKKIIANRGELLHNTASLRQLIDYFQREIFNILDEDELNVLTRLSVFRTPVRFKAFQDRRTTRQRRNLNYLLHSLQKKMLISIDSLRQEISLHDTLRDAVYSMLLYPADLHALAAQYYLDEGSVASIVESMYHLAKCGQIKKIMLMLEDEVVNEKYGFIEHGYAGPLLDILGAIDMVCPKDKLDPKELIYLRSIQAKALAMIQHWEESDQKLQDAMSIAKSLADSSMMAYTLKTYGETSYLQNKLDTVEDKLLAAAKIFEHHESNYHFQASLNSIYLKLARLYFLMGKHQKSKIYSQKAKTTPTGAPGIHN